ncbi:MAG: UDP-N-acetylglucosamine 2-epimerase (non-hydrolyzing) [Candidatus Acidiferrales bacterium]
MSLLPNEPIKILTVVGARPNFMKVAPIIRAVREHNKSSRGPQIEHLLVHTGQHYDEAMSDRFFADLGLPKPDVHLGVGSGSHTVQTAEVMKKFEDVLLREKPAVVIVVGDVNSTVACAMVAAKVTYDSSGARALIAHVESGLRSFDRTMPEEVNRVVTDHVSDFLFVTEESGLNNLRNEGISSSQVHFVGNTMIDSVLAFKEKAEASTALEDLGLRLKSGNGEGDTSIRRYGLLTLHRPSNVDNPEAFVSILGGLEELAKECPIVFPVHPRTRRRIAEFGLENHVGVTSSKVGGGAPGTQASCNGIVLTDPLGYLDFLCLMKHAAIVVTDSGGIQEETTCLGVPCVTVRENTERPVTVEHGTNIIAGIERDRIKDAIQLQTQRRKGAGMPQHWDGHAAERIVEVLIQTLQSGKSSREATVPQSCA